MKILKRKVWEYLIRRRKMIEFYSRKERRLIWGDKKSKKFTLVELILVRHKQRLFGVLKA